VKTQFIIGIDEAGRGPLAGPVAVGVIKVPVGFNIKKHFPGVADSKKLSEKKREEIYALLLAREKAGDVSFCVRFASNTCIDEHGITRAVRHSIYKGVRTLAPSSKGVCILLDGLLHAPLEYKQKTIVRGDVTEPIISLASIAAKVERDRLMKKLAKKYPMYAFEVHKGYGTAKHRKAIKRFGLSKIHRRSFCKGTLMPRRAAKKL
jgi:ribonuclease HII